jgi:hypothetical protein
MLKQTKGTFEARGILMGFKEEKSFTEITTKSGKKMRMMNLRLKISDTEMMFLHMNGMEQEYVYFSKPVKNNKPEIEKIDWVKRMRWSRDGFRLIGVSLGLTKNEETKKNELVTLTPFDAIDYIETHGSDGISVFVKGTIEYSSYEDKDSKEVRKATKFIPQALYLAKDEIDFSSDKFVKQAEFAQPIVFTGVEHVEFEKSFKYFINGIIIGYNNVEDVSLETNESLAKQIKERVKPFNGITLTGKIQSTQVVETVTTEVWGEASSVGKAKTPSRVTMQVTGARPETLDTESYTKKIVESFRDECSELKKSKNASAFESQEGGEKSKVDSEVESGW